MQSLRGDWHPYHSLSTMEQSTQNKCKVLKLLYDEYKKEWKQKTKNEASVKKRHCV